ncbi:MAG: hypothetical protein ACYCYO_02080 [Bacilli bacterium]
MMIAMVDQTRGEQMQGVQTQTGQSVRSVFEGWYTLVRRERQLAVAISRQEERLTQLRDRLSPAGILGAFRNLPQVNADIRPGGGHGDKIGDLVAIVDEREQDVILSLLLLRIQCQDTREELCRIDDAVAELSDSHRRALTLYYRERLPWSGIRLEMYVSRTTVYRLIDEGIEELEARKQGISGHNQDIIRYMSMREK